MRKSLLSKIPGNSDEWGELLQQACAERSPQLLELAEEALQACPMDHQVLYFSAVAALIAENPKRCQKYLTQIEQYFGFDQSTQLLRALALAQQGGLGFALKHLKNAGLQNIIAATAWFYGDYHLQAWLREWLRQIYYYTPGAAVKPRVTKAPAAKRTVKSETAKKSTSPVKEEVAIVLPEMPELPHYQPKIDLRLDFTNTDNICWEESEQIGEDLEWFRLRAAFAHLGLLQEFDELLCLPLLHQVQTYWYQVETVRKVLRSFRGRVLLADEVGLGKTIEAGMVLKEYMLRGMVEKVLILTPASLVGQWQEEMATKFDIPFATSYQSLLKNDPAAFWAQPRVIASLATARRQEQLDHLAGQTYDMVIVDEAHHLKSRTTKNYQLIDVLKKRFLLLLSATPVQNSLVELYNLLTLLKPGIFNTEKEFRAAYMTPGKPRVPVNRERMRDLMRDVMIRNTRALVDVRLPSRHAVTLRLEADDAERECYQTLDALVREIHTAAPGHHRLALHHLLSAAGSSPAAATAAIHRFTGQGDERWDQLHASYQALALGVKEAALLELLRRNPDEKKMVFIHHRETLQHLDAVLREQDIPFARFDGSISGPEKDAAIEAFRDKVPVLLCTQSGGEGRNVQFCNTLINYDLPWNPMVIEQRIGRIHRIGQQREVFIFNLVAQGTLESQVLHILDEKINMFELVVGEIDAILGEMDEQHDFAEAVFTTWVETTTQHRDDAFSELAERMVKAKQQYEAVKELDEVLFGDEFET